MLLFCPQVKYKVEVAEYAFTVHSTHSAPHLVVLSEYLPHVGDEGIKVELLQPAPESTLQVTVLCVQPVSHCQTMLCVVEQLSSGYLWLHAVHTQLYILYEPLYF